MKIPRIKLRHWIILVAFFAFSFWWFKDVRLEHGPGFYYLEGNVFGISYEVESTYYTPSLSTCHVLSLYHIEKYGNLGGRWKIRHAIIEFRPEVILCGE